jgi:hypothetical protein
LKHIVFSFGTAELDLDMVWAQPLHGMAKPLEFRRLIALPNVVVSVRSVGTSHRKVDRHRG